MCIRVLTIFKCACPHRNTLVCPHHVHALDPSSTTTTSDLSSNPSSRPTTSSSSSDTPSSSPTESPSQPPSDSPEITTEDSDDFQKGFTPRLPSALQGHKLWTPLPGKENQRWEHCPGYLAKSRALAIATSTSTSSNSKSSTGTGSGDVTTVGKETQCAEYKATDPKYRRRWEVKTGLCEDCRGVHGMDGPGAAEEQKVVAEKVMRIEVGRGVKVKGVVQEERGRARSRAATDPTPSPKVGAMKAPMPRSGQVDEGNVVKGVSSKAVGKRVVMKRIATL